MKEVIPRKSLNPVSILGLDGAPQAEDNFNVLQDEKEAKQIAKELNY